MAKKTTLDLLEITPEEPAKEIPRDEVTAENGIDDGSSREDADGDLFVKIRGWVHKPLCWIILSSVMLLGLTAGFVVGFYQVMDREAPAAQKKHAGSVTPTPLPEERQGVLERMVVFEGMVVDQKDEKGNLRIVFCDVALELENLKTASTIVGDRVDVRSVIFDVLKKEPAQEGLSPEGRGRLKEKLKNELNRLLVEDLVKKVYFTRYELD